MRAPGALLERFRRPAAVPAAASDEVDVELMPVLAALDKIDEEANRLRADAEREAARRLAAAAAEAERVVGQWRRIADAERLRAEAAEREARAQAAHRLESEAEREAARVRARGLERIPALVASVIACIEEGER